MFNQMVGFYKQFFFRGVLITGNGWWNFGKFAISLPLTIILSRVGDVDKIFQVSLEDFDH